MKVLHLNTSDINGGAARAAYRLHQGLQRIGLTSQMLVQDQVSDDSTVVKPATKLQKGLAKIQPILNILPLLLFSPQRDRVPYSLQWFPDAIATQIAQIAPDLINLHWISDGYIQIETLAKLNKPIVWTLHDMWPFTGGCHYSQECDRYTKSCGACPQLGSTREWDLSRWVWQRKAKAWRKLNLTIVTPSNWLAQCASASSLFRDFRVEVIPHGLDITTFKPIEQRLAREILNLPPDKQIVLFGAIKATSDQRKGFHLLQPALQFLSQTEWQDRLETAIFGASEPMDTPNLGFKSHYLGRLNDDFSLVLAYSAADVMIVPSLQESFGQTAFESLACGTPVVGFNATGLKDIVEHEQNGYLAQPYEVEDLARGIAWVLEDRERYEKLCDRAREKVEQEFTIDLQAQRYLALYLDI
jgi:glycosyltransferase involved in cell wall biosynthesis